MQSLRLFFLLLITSMVLTGCFTFKLIRLDQSLHMTSDHIVKIGIPSPPIPEYPYAIVMYGEKQNYIATDAAMTPPYINDILQNLNLNDITILNKEITFIDQLDEGYQSAQLSFSYKKSLPSSAELTKEDREKIKAIGFTKNTKNNVFEKVFNVRITPIDINQKYPLHSEAQTDFILQLKPDYASWHNTYNPFAFIIPVIVLAADIVTYPLQTIGWMLCTNIKDQNCDDYKYEAFPFSSIFSKT
jgi:hypothetical protein